MTETAHGQSIPRSAPEPAHDTGFNFAFLDEQTKRMVRRAALKAVAIPGYQVAFGSRELPMPFGWGTGGIQLTASLIGKEDCLKVIDQGADDTTNAVSIRRFFQRTTGVSVTTDTREASLIQTRHRIPETPLGEDQIMIYQVPLPEPLTFIEPRRSETRKMHAYEEYGPIHLQFYEDVAKHGQIAWSYDYPVMVERRYLMRPSPVPRFDNPKLDQSPALHLFGAGREQRIYAVPPYTTVKPLEFDDFPFSLESWKQTCALCGSSESFLDEIIINDAGERRFICSDTDYCAKRRMRIGAAGEGGAE